MPSWTTLRSQVLRRITPTPAQTRRARAAARTLAKRLSALASERGLDVRPTLVGSIAKGTHLANPLDVDLFILFPTTTPRADLEREGLALGHAALPNALERYAEHPYVHGRLDGFPVDVVPAYRLRSARGRLSAVDRTPFHTRYVRRHTDARRRAEIRLFKAFLRGVRCYGAETATGGVSGYLAELLVLHHGSFLATLRAVARWRPPVQISLDGEGLPMGGGPLVVVDPVDAARNAGAAVTSVTFERLQRAARAFLKAPSKRFFFPEPRPALPPARLRRLAASQPVFAVAVQADERDPAKLRPQGQRLLGKVGRALGQYGFRMVRGDVFEVGPGALLLLIEHDPKRLPARRLHEGPLESNVDHRDRFVEKWRRHPDALGPPKLVGGRWQVMVRQRERTPLEAFAPRLGDLLQGFSFKTDGARLVAGKDLAATEAWRDALTAFLEPREPWQVPATRS